MSSTKHAVLALALAACGDNIDPSCEPVPPLAPPNGPFADPLAIELPADCVAGGLRDLPGRWFQRVPEDPFSFGYPKYEGSCETGFRRANWSEDMELTDGIAQHTWSDGTRFYYREHYVFEFPNGVYEFATMVAFCMLPDGSLAGVSGSFDTDSGPVLTPVIAERFEPRDSGASGLALVGEIGSESTLIPYNVAVDGTHAYTAGPFGFDVIDVSDPTSPTRVAHIDGDFNDVKIVRAADKVVAYLAPQRGDRTAIIDVTIPSAPVRTGNIGEYSHSIFVTQTPPRVYLGNYSPSIPVYDVAAPLSPVRIANIPVGGRADVGIHDIHIQGDRVYADKTTDGVFALDVSTGLTTPVALGSLPTSYSHASWAGVAGGREIVIHGDEGMTPTEGGAFLRVLDADRTSPTFMTEIGRYQSSSKIGIHNIVLEGDRAYIAYYQDGVRVVDLSDPTQPREIGRYNLWDPETAPGGAFEGAFGLTIVGDLVYVADSIRGLVILRIDV